MSSNTNQPSKTSGQYHSAKGTVTESLGSMTGSESWRQAGAEEHAQGEGEYNAAQAQGYAEGTKDRMGGRKDAVFGAVTDDRERQASGNARRDKGEMQQDINRPS